MKKLFLMTFFMVLICAPSLKAEIPYLMDIMAQATPEERRSLGKLLKQIQVVIDYDAKFDKPVAKVIYVEKNSVYDRAGLKPGDHVYPTGSKKIIKPTKYRNRSQKNPP